MAVVVVSAALILGCSSTDDGAVESPAAPVPLGPGSHGKGTPLLDGFIVPAGAQLVDGPLPPVQPPYTRPDGSPVGSWQAIMVVTGDPRRVIADFESQATTNGYVLQPAADLATPNSPATAFCRRDGARYRCFAIGAVRDARTITPFDPLPPEQFHGLSIEFDRAPPSEGAAATTFLTFTFHDDGPQAWGFGDPSAGPDAPLGVDPPPVPPRWPALPQVGDPLEPDDHPHLEVLPGSTVLMPVRVENEGSTSTSILRVDGPARRTFDRYVGAARAVMPAPEPGEANEPPETTVEDTRLGHVTRTTMTVESSDRGVTYSILLLERPDGPSTLRIQANWVRIRNEPT